MTDTGVDTGTGWRGKLDRFWTWRAQLSEEAIRLPQTLAELRATIEDLRKVSARLEVATHGIETALHLAEASGIAPLARQLDAAATEMEDQVRTLHEHLPGGQLVNQAVNDLQKTVDAFRSLIPQNRPSY